MRRLALFIMLAAQPAFAHAILIDSTPAPNAHIKPGKVAIVFRYNSRIDSARSKLTLTAADGVAHRLATRPADKPDLLAADATVVPGAYTLRWQVLAKDGHITRGTVPFIVDAS